MPSIPPSPDVAPERQHALTFESRRELKEAIDRAKRARLTCKHTAPTPEWRHGTAQGYSYDGCRCDRCRAAWSDYHRARRANEAK